MTQPSFEHLAILQLLDRVQDLECTNNTLMAVNAMLSRRPDRLELLAKRDRQRRPERVAE